MERKQYCIGVVENDPQQLQFFRYELHQAGYGQIETVEPSRVFELLKNSNPNLLLIGDGLPKNGAEDILVRIREFSHLPVFYFGHRNDTDYVSRILELGADKYFPKTSLSPRILVAHIDTVLRRENFLEGTGEGPAGIFRNGVLTIDYSRHLVFMDERVIPLGPREYEVLSFIARRVGKHLKSGTILSRIWGAFDRENEHLLRVRISMLRKKLVDGIDGCPQIVTDKIVRGYYMPRYDSPEEV